MISMNSGVPLPATAPPTPVAKAAAADNMNIIRFKLDGASKIHKSKKFTRNRTGCLNCKKKKRRCDEQKPACSSCQRANKECCYSTILSFKSENMITRERREPFIRLLEIENWLFLNSTCDDIMLSHSVISDSEPEDGSDKFRYSFNTELQHTEYTTNILSDASGQTSGGATTLPTNFGAFLPQDKYATTALPDNGSEWLEKDLFNHYVLRVCSRKAFAVTEHNEFKSLIIPNVDKFPALMEAVLALSASDLFHRTNNSMFKELALKYKERSINNLHSVLDQHESNGLFVNYSESTDTITGLVSCILVLCTLEIGDKNNCSWYTYLKEASLLFCTIDQNEIVSSKVLNFAYRYFSLRYILFLTSTTHAEFDLFTDTSPWPIIDKIFDTNVVDHVLGCSPRLLRIIFNISGLRFSFLDENVTPQDFVAKYEQLYGELVHLEQRIADNASEVQAEQLILCSTAYRYSAVLYFHISLSPLVLMMKSEDVAVSVFQSEIKKRFKSEYSYYSKWLMDHLVSLLQKQSVPSNVVLHVSPLFPTWCLFILSICDNSSHVLATDLENQRRIVMNLFHSIIQLWPKSSAQKLKFAIETVWKILDLNADMKEFTDWRDILDRAGFKLSLT